MTYGDEAKLRHAEYQKAHRQGVEERTDEKGLLRFANDYYMAYLTLKQAYSKDIELISPKFYLLCHALELALKSWLRKEGYTVKQLVKLDHNLIALLSDIIEKYNVVFPPDAVQAIEQANYYYDTKQYEYYVRGSKSFPDPDHLASYVKLFLGMTKSHVIGIDSIKQGS